MNKQNIYKKIKDIAYLLHDSKDLYTRSDLAYNLKDLGIIKDGFDVGKLVWEAFVYYNHDNKIKNVFYTNDYTKLIVPEYEIYNLIETNQTERLFPVLNKKLEGIKQSSSLLNAQTAAVIKGEIIVDGSNIMSQITGTVGINKVTKEASLALEYYTKLVDSYSILKDDIKSSITDFIFLRCEINRIYQQNCTALIDIYGDSIKVIAPEIFDFDNIEWLDVSSMIKNINLDYEKLNNTCQALISEINDNFGRTLDASTNHYKSSNDKTVALALAGLNMFNHFIDAKQKTITARKDLLSLKDKMSNDAVLIAGDSKRLMAIFKQVNDIYIPKANAFYRFSNQVLSNELENMINALYKSPEIKILKKQRDELFKTYSLLRQEIADNNSNIDYYREHISRCKEITFGRYSQYQESKQKKPNKPFFLIDWITLGALKRSYNRDIYEWNEVCSPVIKEYESVQVDLKIDQEELFQLQSTLKVNEKQCSIIKKELSKIDKQIKNKILFDSAIKKNVGIHLEDLIKLLWIAKDIICSKLDSCLLKTTQLNDINANQLPASIHNNVQVFINSLRTQSIDLETSNEFVKDIKKLNEEINKKDAQAINQLANETLRKSINLIEKLADLEIRKVNSKLKVIEYEKELKQLQNKFQCNLTEIDKQSVMLNEIIKQINLSQNNKQLKAALLLLISSSKTPFSEAEFNDFLNGNKTIEL